MRLSERLKKDREQLKRLPDKKSRLMFIWDYYKIPILTLVCVLLISLIAAVNNIGRPQVSMYVVLLNNDSSVVRCDDTVFDRYLEKAGLDLSGKKANIAVDYSLGNEFNESADIETLQVLTALFTVSDLDLYVSPQEYFEYFAKENGLADLSRLIDGSLLEKHKEDLYYCDTADGGRVLAGIILRPGSPLHEASYYHDEVIIGAVSNAANMAEAVAFISEILK
ncbi:MAG: hypothetical protein IIZ28_04160 [Erysipelotrichaceae bacterium]|nr:hypothetical protein [Erysipelotrichaceae bacterium]